MIFDAYKVPSGTVHDEMLNGIRITYTAENEPADIRMGQMISNTKNRRLYAVTSDALVQMDAWGHGALRISSREFIDLLNRTEDEIRSKLYQ